MFAVSFYDADPDAGPEHFQRLVDTYPRHRAYLDEFAKGGEVLMIGTFGNPAVEGSMAVFRSREAAERFIGGDPFVTEGLVSRPRTPDWAPLVFGDSGGRPPPRRSGQCVAAVGRDGEAVGQQARQGAFALSGIRPGG